MANLLAYRGLALLPAAPTPRGLATAGWEPSQETFTWPLWGDPLGIGAVKSLVQMRELVAERPDRSVLAARGVRVVFRVRRIEVGSGANRKVNFTPARVLVSAGS